jgi:hypothetical protein
MPLAEEWRDCVGFEGYYQVSNLGNIRSLDRMVRTNAKKPTYRQHKGKNLKPRKDAYGYLITCFWVEGKKSTVKIHRLVLDAFIGVEPRFVCDHLNGVRDDNRLENLRWATVKENNNNRHKCNGASGHVGVRMDKRNGRWQSYITVEGKFMHVAYCETKEQAVIARNKFIGGSV